MFEEGVYGGGGGRNGSGGGDQQGSPPPPFQWPSVEMLDDPLTAAAVVKHFQALKATHFVGGKKLLRDFIQADVVVWVRDR